MSFIVMCRVSGGVTGTREAQSKKDGKPEFFATREEAEATAQCYRDFMNNPYSTASFRYWVEER